MTDKDMRLFKIAYKKYNLDARENIDEEILKYIYTRIIANKDIIDEMIKIAKEKISFEDIIKIFEQENKKQSKYKQEKALIKKENGFIFATYTTSVGVVAIETSDTLKVLKYFIEAIKTRNSIIISDIEFSEENVKSMLLIIFCEAISKFKLDSNLISIIPYEECDYSKFDKVIYENKIVDKRYEKDEYYIYLEDNYFEKEVEEEKEILKNNKKNVKVLRKNIEETIELINQNKPFAVSIYTRNSKIGYEFINLIHSKNVFVNSTLMNAIETENIENEFYMKKNIMYQLDTDEKINKNNIKNKTEKGLIKPLKNKWYKKILDKIKNFLKLK